MYFKKSFLFCLLIPSFLVSCTKDLLSEVFGSYEIWRTNNTDFKLLSDCYNSKDTNYLIPYSFVNYNFLDTGYSIVSGYRDTSHGDRYINEFLPCYIIPPIPPIPPAGIGGVGSLISATTDSVVRSDAAIDDAF